MNRRRDEMRLAKKTHRRHGRASHRLPLHLLSGSATRRSLFSRAATIYVEQIRQTQKILNQVFKLPVIQRRPVRERAVQVENGEKMKKVDKSAQYLVIPILTSKRSPSVNPQSIQRRTHLFPRGSYQSTSSSFDCQPPRELISEFREPSEFTESTGHIEQICDAREHEEVVQQVCFVEQETQMSNVITRRNEIHQDCPPPRVSQQNISSRVISPILSFRYEDEIGSFSLDSEKSSCETCCLQEKRKKIDTNFLIVLPQKSGSWPNSKSSLEPEPHVKSNNENRKF